MSICNTCQVCLKRVQSFSYSIDCKKCFVKYHIKCVNINRDDVVDSLWYCTLCVQEIFPFNHLDNDDDFYATVMEGVVECPYRLHEIGNKVFLPFEINDSFDTPFSEIDPDYHFYTNVHFTVNMKCDYYFEDHFRQKHGFTDSSQLSLFHLNIKSLSKHYDELDTYLNSLEYKFAFIGLTETWLDKDKQYFFDLENYTSINKFREGRKGGGVSLQISQNIPYIKRNDLVHFDSEMESIFIKIDKCVYNTNSNIIIGVIYRMPNACVDVFTDRLTDIMNVIEKEHKLCYIMGDLNIDFLKADDHKSTGALLDVLYSYNVFPLITKPTRVTEKTATLIDHIWTNNFDVDTHHIQGILCTSMTDHYAIFHIAGNTSNDNAPKGLPLMRRDMSQKNIMKFIDEMKLTSWQSVLDENNTQLAYSIFHEIVSSTYNTCFPLKKISKKYYVNKPWLTSALKESIKIKNKLFVSTKRHGNDNMIPFYKRYRNKLNQLLRSAERKHYHDLLNEHKSNIRKSWQIIKSIINKRKYTPISNKFKDNDKVISDGNIIANKFNNFFINVGKTLAKTIPGSNKMPLDYITDNNVNKFYFIPVTDSEVSNILGTIKDSAAGWDGLKAFIIKQIKEVIVTPLVHICNRSFMTGIFPNELKIANVVPIFKSGDDMVFSNYRPVSVLPIFSKLLERLVYNRLIKFINDNKLLYDYQFGFQRGKSTQHAVMMLVDKITDALDNKECVIGIFLDFSKAFDTVDHEILLLKLEKYGIQGTELQWLNDYLSNRRQYVTYSNYKSSFGTITCGVPQGSILGPLLFLMYINDLSNVSEYCFSLLFADDTNMFHTGKDMKIVCDQVNEDLKNVQEWLNCNKLSLNIRKTHYMIFTPRNEIIDDIDVKFCNNVIERVYVTKFLGVQIDSQLTWKTHVEYTCKKLSKCIGILSKARKKLHRSSLINLYYAFAYPYFIYCNVVWGKNYTTTLDRLILLQKKLIRIVTCSPFRAHTEPLFFANRILNVTDINDYTIGTFMYEYIDGNVTDIFNNYFQRNRDIHGLNIRNADDLHVPYSRLDVRKFSIKIAGPNLWNSIPLYIKNSTSTNLFKRNMRAYLLDRKLAC